MIAFPFSIYMPVTKERLQCNIAAVFLLAKIKGDKGSNMAEKPIKAQCCYCGKIYRDGRLLNGHVTHGICPQCYVAQIKKIQNDEGVYHGD